MSTSLWAQWGEYLGISYFYYALGLMFGCLGVHLLLLGAYVASAVRLRSPRIRLVLEVIYGGLNPVVYLLVFDPALFRTATSFWLQVLCWSLLAAYWGLRLFGSLSALTREALRLPVRGVLTACMGWVLAMGLRDLCVKGTEASVGFGMHPAPSGVLIVLALSPLYLFPLVIAGLQRRRTSDSETWTGVEGFFLPSAMSRVVVVPCLLGVLLLSVAVLWRPSEADTRELLLAHREEILSASAQSSVDPRLLASILFVTHRQHTTPFRSALEELVASVWLTDEKSHALLSEALDPSLGLMQIKPKTMLTAIWLHHASGGTAPLWAKHYRDIPTGDKALERLPTPELGQVPFPSFLGQNRKPEVVEALFEPAHNIALCAFLLDLYAMQWETARPAWSIRQRPEILATLYQIGFERSVPKPDPQANTFGQSVLLALEEPWMREHFGPVR